MDQWAAVVDDHALNRAVHARMLGAAGWTDVVSVDGGRAALELIAERGMPALLLLDLHMPEVDGHQVLAQVRQLDRATCIVVITGDADERVHEQALRAGADRVLVKPVPIADLLEAAGEVRTRACR